MYRIPKLAGIIDQWCKFRRIRCSNLKTDLRLFFCSERQLQFNVLPWQPDCKCYLYLLYLMLEITENLPLVVLWEACVFHGFCFHNAVMCCVRSSCALVFFSLIAHRFCHRSVCQSAPPRAPRDTLMFHSDLEMTSLNMGTFPWV